MDPSLPHTAALLKAAKTKSEFQRVQCIWLRQRFDMAATDIAVAVGWAVGTVRHVLSKYRREGEQSLLGSRGRGGRRHEHLTLDEETSLIDTLVQRMRAGVAVDARYVQREYEKTIGHSVARSTIYRLLNRHGCQYLLAGANPKR